MREMIRFLPTYVGSKQYWVPRLQKYQGSDIVELFAGSAVLSANLAKTAILNDADPIVYKILKNFDQLEVPEVFTTQDYFKCRSNPDWFKHVYCLQKMSFSGVFRYSKNGYNVPLKKNATDIRVRTDYEAALSRWKALNPTVLNLSYERVLKLDSALGPTKVIIADPPYESTKAAYCSSNFDYTLYWKIMVNLANQVRKGNLKALILFDRAANLEKQKVKIIETRKMRVNGKHRGDEEAIAIFENSQWLTSLDQINQKVIASAT